jgi:hypothetical protein
MKVTCRNCKYSWDYGGTKLFYATCPNCLYKAPLPAEKKEVEEQ